MGGGKAGGCAGYTRQRGTHVTPATHLHTPYGHGRHSERSRRHPQPPNTQPRFLTWQVRWCTTPHPRHLASKDTRGGPLHAKAAVRPSREGPPRGCTSALLGIACAPPTCLPALPAAAPPLAAGGNRKSPTPQPSPRPNFNTLHCCTFCAPQTHKLSQPQSHCHCWPTSCGHAGRTAGGSHQYK